MVNGVGPVAFDASVIAIVQGWPVPIGVWESITAMGGPVLITVDVLVVVILVVRREFVLALLFAGTLIAVTLAVDHAKDFVARPRPDDPLVAGVRLQLPVRPRVHQHRVVRPAGHHRVAQRPAAGVRAAHRGWRPSSW